jgi:hypothetical protein
MKRFVFMLAAAMVLFAGVAFAQEATVDTAANVAWGPIAAGGIGVLVMLVIQLIGVFVPGMNGGLKQVIAIVASPLLTWAASILSNALGYPVDFSGLIEALAAATGSGFTAMGVFDVLKSLGVVGVKR